MAKPNQTGKLPEPAIEIENPQVTLFNALRQKGIDAGTGATSQLEAVSLFAASIGGDNANAFPIGDEWERAVKDYADTATDTYLGGYNTTKADKVTGDSRDAYYSGFFAAGKLGYKAPHLPSALLAAVNLYCDNTVTAKRKGKNRVQVHTAICNAVVTIVRGVAGTKKKDAIAARAFDVEEMTADFVAATIAAIPTKAKTPPKDDTATPPAATPPAATPPAATPPAATPPAVDTATPPAATPPVDTVDTAKKRLAETANFLMEQESISPAVKGLLGTLALLLA